MKEETILNAEVAEGSEQPVEYKKSEKVAGRRIGYNYIIVKSLKESGKNDVVKCFYIKSLTKWGFCVIKEGTYGDTKDIEGRDIKDRLMWQKEVHAALQGKVRIPKLIGSFEENGNYYLVMEYLRGKALGDLVKGKKANLGLLREGGEPARKLLKYILQVIDLIHKLHQQGYVHRDVTATNFVLLRSGKMCLIDMELTYCVKDGYPAMPFRLGTTGYMSPQQMAVEVPTVKEDIYALGALMIQVLSGLSAGKLTGGAGIDFLTRRINYLAEDAAMADIILRCLSDNPYERPELSAIREVVKAYQQDMKRRQKRPVSAKRLFSEDEARETVQRGVESIATTIFADPVRGWFADGAGSERDGSKKLEKTWQASLNAGGAGIVFFLSKAKEAGYDVSINQYLIQLALDLMERKYVRQDRDSHGLFFGADGLAVALTSALKGGLIPVDGPYIDWLGKLLSKRTKLPDFVSGWAGQGIANLYCADMISPEHCARRTAAYVSYFGKIQQKGGYWSIYEQQKGTVVDNGLAHGTAGIAYFLLEYARIYNDNDVLSASLAGIQWMMAANGKKELIWGTGKKNDIGYSMGSGCSGIALTFLKAFEITGEPAYADFARSALLAPEQEMMWSNLSLLNGSSGLGIVYLEAFRVLGEQQWLDRATSIFQLNLHLKRTNVSGDIYWLANHEAKPTAGLMLGNSGILYFMMKYLNSANLQNGLLFF